MASSRRSGKRRAAACFAAAMLSAAVCAAPGAAWAAYGDEPVEVEVSGLAMRAFDQVVQAAPGETLQMGGFCPLALEASCEPASIEAGIDCGMDWMCGIDPCLCGSADHWGSCSCNGLSTEVAEVRIASSDESVVKVVEALGRVWAVPQGTGRAELVCTASLRHFSDGVARFPVSVGGASRADSMLVAASAYAILVLGALLVGAVALARRRREGDGS